MSEKEETQQPVVNEYTYALLQETSGEECESWYYFIRYQGNEAALAHLEKQLDDVDWYVLDDLSTFVIETQYLVSEQTAKQMTKVDLNPASFHRKFDGKLKMIDLGFKPHYKTEKKMAKAFDKLSYGKIEDYVDDEDIDPEDMNNNSDSSSEEETLSASSSSSESSKSENEEKNSKRKGKLPSVLIAKKFDIPRVAAVRQHKKNKNKKKN